VNPRRLRRQRVHLQREILVGARQVRAQVGRVARHLDGVSVVQELHDPQVALAAAGAKLVVGQDLVDDVAAVPLARKPARPVVEHVAVEHKLPPRVILDHAVPKLLAVVHPARQTRHG